MLGQLGQMTVNLADNIMVGKLGATSLAAISFANAIYAIFFVLGMGISFALPPLISEADGKGDKVSISRFFKHSLLVNTIIGIVSLLAILATIPLMDHIGQDPDIIPLAKKYLLYAAWTMVPYMVFQALRCYSDGMSETKLPMIVIITGNILNILLNYALIFGNWGMPALGIEGASLGSLIARLFMVIMITILLFKWKNLWHYIAACDFKRYQMEIIRKIMKLGVPTSLQMFFEVSAFSGASLITGMISENAQAAHQISINLASITFMICTGLGMAATIRVGNQLGLKDYQKLRDAGNSSILQVVLIMTFFAGLFILLRNVLPHIYIDDPVVISIASMLLIYAAIFQIPDGVQVTAQSALRGIQDVKAPTFITFLSYWVIGLPVSYITAIYMGWGPAGVWIGLIVGLTISALLLTLRFRKLSILLR